MGSFDIPHAEGARGNPQGAPDKYKYLGSSLHYHPHGSPTNLPSYARQISRHNVTHPSFTRRPTLYNIPIPLYFSARLSGGIFFAHSHSKFFLKSPKKRTPRGYFKKFLRFVARLRATFGVFWGISERALIWVRDPRMVPRQ